MQEGLVQCISLLHSEFEIRLSYTMHYLKTKQKNASVQKEKWVTGKEKKRTRKNNKRLFSAHAIILSETLIVFN